MFRTSTAAILLIFSLTACDALQELADDLPSSAPSGPSGDASPTAPTSGGAPQAAPSTPIEASDDGSVTVKNPLGVEISGKLFVDPAAGSAEHTLIAALDSQAKNKGFNAFVKHFHPTATQETEQLDRLKAYTFEQSQGARAAACLHQDGKGVIVVARNPATATIDASGAQGERLSLWCGEGRMPVPFTLYPDGDVWKFTQFGLN